MSPQDTLVIEAMERRSLGYKKSLFPFVPGEFEHFGNVKWLWRQRSWGWGQWKTENSEKYAA